MDEQWFYNLPNAIITHWTVVSLVQCTELIALPLSISHKQMANGHQWTTSERVEFKGPPDTIIGHNEALTKLHVQQQGPI